MKTKGPHIALECPNCLHRMFTDEMCDEGFQPAPNVAKEMDFTVCSKCATLLRYDSDKSVRIATEDDMEDLEPNSERDV